MCKVRKQCQIGARIKISTLRRKFKSMEAKVGEVVELARKELGMI